MKIKSTTRIALAVLLFATMAVLSPPSVHADPPGPHGPGKEKLIGLGCDPITGMPAIEVWGVGLNKEIPVTVRAPDGKTATYTLRTDNAGNGKVEYGMPGEMYSLVAIHFADGRREFRNINCPPVGPKGSQGQKNSGSRATAGNSPGSGTAGDPISTSIGEYFFQMPLFDLGGPLPVQFALNYAASMDKSSGSDNDPFGGDNFSHNMHVALKRMDDTSAVIFFGSGNVVQFQKSANGWLVIAEETGYQLREGDAHYYLLDPIAELIYTFDKPGGAVAWLTRVEDRNGNTLTFTNDSTGRVTRVDDGKGRSLIFTYTDPSDTWTWAHLAQVSDGNDRAIKFEYKSTTEPLTTHLVSVSNALKQTTKFTHEGAITNTVVSAITYPLGNTPYTNKYEVINGQWAVTSQTDALGNTTQLKIDKSVATMTDALGNVTQHTHTDARLLSDMTDASNKSAAITYDDQGRRTEITDRLGDTTKIVYHPQTGNFASVTNAKGDTISYAYTAQEQTIGEAKFTFYNLTKVDYPDKTSAKFDYDAKGNVITYTDQAAQVWKFTYTPTGLPTTATNPANGVATFTYNPDQTLASRKDSETGDTRFTYDNFKRVTKITYADRSEVAFTYNANDQITSVTDPLKGVTKFEYDANGNLIKTTDAAGKETISTYDKMDRLIKTTNRLGQASSLAYDKLGRVESATDATGVMAQFAYDPRGWLNKIKLGESAWKYGYDDEGVVNSLTSPSGNTTKIQSDKIGLTSSATNALNQTSSLTRDASNRITKVTDPLKRDTSYTYDARGALNGVTAPVVGSSKYEYDAAGNLIKIVDLNGGEWKFTYSPMGRLLTETDPLGKVTQYKYDERGRLSLVTYPDASTRIISYDALGNIARVTFSDKIEKKFVYDALGRLIEADGVKFSRDAEGRITQTSEVFGDFGSLNGATYDNAGRVKTVAYNDGATSASLSASFTVTYVYDEKTGLLKQVTDSLTGTQIDFTYDEDLRLTKITRSNQVNTTLTWDNADRLIGIQDAKTSEVSQTSEVSNLQYTLDDAGQVTQLSGKLPLDPSPNLQSQISNLQYNNASQLTTAGYSYDAQGRLTASPSNKFAWDADSQLVGIDSVKLSYNGLGEIISREEGGRVTRFVYNYALDLAPIVAEMQETKPLRFYVWTPGGSLLYAIDASDGNKVSHYHFDRTGSTLALTDADGKMTDAYAYDPYGKVSKHDGKNTQPFTFAGHWGVRQDGSLYHMRARWYDPATARFLSREPLWPQTFDPMALNPYQYGTGNPITNVDMNGLYAEPHSAYEQRMWADWIAEMSAQCPDCTETEILDAASGRLLALRARLKADALKLAQAAKKRGLGVAGWVAQVQAAALQQAQAQAMLGGLGLGRLIAQNQEALREAQAQALMRRLGGLGLGRLIAQNQEALRQAQAQAMLGGLGLGRLIAQNQEALRQAQAQALMRRLGGLGLGRLIAQNQEALRQAQKQRIADWWARFAAATREQAAIQRAVPFMVNVGLRQTPNDKWPAGVEWER